MTHDLMKRIKELDVFSLIVFRHIFESGHANEVARNLGVSPSKVSRSLNALRAAFNNDLFYRRQQGLKPTLFAEKLYPNICVFTDSLEQFKDVLLDEHYPHEDIILKLAVVPMFMPIVAQRLAAPEIQQQLGKIQLYCWDENSIDNLHKGDLDFGISVTQELMDYHELTQQKIIDTQALSVVAKSNHPIWQSYAQFDVEHLADFPFVYIATQGFNDRLDPFEQYCRETEKSYVSISPVKSYAEWYCHLLTMNSVSIAHIGERNLINDLPGLRCERMPQPQFLRLDNALRTPRIYLIERSKPLRRYNENTRGLIFSTVYELLSDN
ncbi:LysR family transcriptional regulator [Shewanella avicenniae]|uniref:LysR family transcriptional regulator n=1 Tax=Shewanella avicenniae TaxID=2814294 RepID=A0ABX7QV61_9GAMM|nr:LysR family transcriptional regulator [Shewanella avicenniae]QSX34535.1 LysR family transcriptional regulator [Shewanella avicenniae]